MAKTAKNADNLIVAKDLKKVYGDFTAVNGINFEVCSDLTVLASQPPCA